MLRPRCALFVFLPLAAQWGTFHAAYEEGLAAQRRGDHATALRAFEAAIVLRAEPSARVKTYGLNFLFNYHPYLRSAESALALGDLARADRALAASERYGIEPAAERARLRERLDAARSRKPETPSPAADPPLRPKPEAMSPPKTEPITQAVPTSLSLPPAPSSARAVPPPKRTVKPPSAEPHAIAQPPTRNEPPITAAAPPPPSRAGVLIGGSLGTLLALGGILWARRRRHRSSRNPYRVDLNSLPQATQVSPNRISEMPQQRGPYRILRILGRGGCATTYLAEHEDTGASVALKIPHTHILMDEDFRHRFHREASLGLRLQHPRIVRILDAGPKEGEPWMAMELVRGTTLDEYLRARGPLPLAQAIHLALEVSEALAYAHAQGVVHRDLKPANLMLGEGGVTVMDFGIARLTEGEGVTTTNVFLGTPTYAAPESLRSPRVGPAADRYALGIILFELLVGRPPFMGETTYDVLRMHQVSPLPPLRELRPDVDPHLARLVQRLCLKPPEERPEDPEMLQILRQLAAAHPL